MNNLDEIALRVGMDLFGCEIPADVKYARALLAELSKDKPVAYGCFHFGGKDDGKLYAHLETEELAVRYVHQVHQSSDCITLRVKPLFTRPIPANTAEIEQRVAEACAKMCEKRGEENRIAEGKPNGDRSEFYCADDIRNERWREFK